MKDYGIVWLDAGHGGHDSGAVGPRGLKESDVVLAVNLRTEVILARYGVIVMHSRESDVYLSPSERSVKANAAKAVLFVSTHCNAAKRPASGIETFAMPGSANGERLATSVQDSMLDEFPNRLNRGVKFRSNLIVLRKTRMPAALVELEFIHTAAGEAHFSNNETIDKCAEALAYGILQYLGIVAESRSSRRPAVVNAKPELAKIQPKTDPRNESLRLKYDHLQKVHESTKAENVALKEKIKQIRALANG